MHSPLFLAEEFLKVEEALGKVEEALAHLNICLTYPFIPKKNPIFVAIFRLPLHLVSEEYKL